jgi:hypothetical protein
MTEVLEKFKEVDKSNFIDKSQIFELYNNFQAYIKTLSTLELCILFNICGIIFIMSCLSTIIFTFYGDFLINKLNLEKKYRWFYTIAKNIC